MAIPTWFTRLQAELEELETRLVKLQAYLEGPQSSDLSEQARGLLIRQRYLMIELDSVLRQRIQQARTEHCAWAARGHNALA